MTKPPDKTTLLQYAAAAGSAKAQLDLGTAYSKGEGVPRDPAKAVGWWQKAAEQGNASAQFHLGQAYAQGFGVVKDMVKAAEWARKSADQGEDEGQVLLGAMYAEGQGVLKDNAKAVDLFRSAAEQGNMYGQLQLGWAFADGLGVAKDTVKAVEWYQKAADQGYAEAQMSLAWAYTIGQGVTKDAAKAVEWYRKAADQGHASAMHNLGFGYYTGEGVPQSFTKAVEWFQKAAKQGSVKSQSNLGLAYSRGEGAPRDLVLAYAWYNLATIGGPDELGEAGLAEAKQRRDLIWRLLSPDQRAEAERISTAWRPGRSLVREAEAKPDAGVSAKERSIVKAGTGTAFLVNKSGKALTASHVVVGCKEVRAEGRDGLVKIAAVDSANDIALLQVPGLASATAPVAKDPEKLRQGEEIVVYGFPLNSVLSSGGNLTPGIVSAKTGLGNNTNQIQITAPVQPGSSGSPVLNRKGEVVGMVTFKISDSEMADVTGQLPQNVNFAVNGQTINAFLAANSVEYLTSGFLSFDKDAADLADEAKKWTIVVECWK